MLNLLTFHLQAICPENNIDRNYQISIGQDLFGSWLLTTLNGRIGHEGRNVQIRP